MGREGVGGVDRDHPLLMKNEHCSIKDASNGIKQRSFFYLKNGHGKVMVKFSVKSIAVYCPLPGQA